MGDVYASAVGTTVLQIKEIPPCPQEFDGALCLFGLKPGVDEAAVRQALGRFGEIESCDLTFESSYGVVRFTTHAAALRAKKANDFSELGGGVNTQYNERSYDGRSAGEGGREDDSGRGWGDLPRPSSPHLSHECRAQPCAYKLQPSPKRRACPRAAGAASRAG